MASAPTFPAITPAPQVEACAACGAELMGPFCAACGERRPRPDDERIGPFLRDQLHEVTSADGKLWRTLKALFVPGKLTREFFDGRRGLYVRPVRVFLVVNLVLFFLLSGNQGTILKGPLQSNYSSLLYGRTASALAADRAATWPGGEPAFVDAFDTHASALAPSLLGVLIPGFALVFALVLWPARARGVRHLVFATHAVSTFLAGTLLLMVGLSLLNSLGGALIGLRVDSIDPILVPTVAVLICVYLGIGAVRVYRIGLPHAVITSVVGGMLCFLFPLWLYRLILFFVTFWTLDPPLR